MNKKRKFKIGIFDSGLGGLVIAKSIRKKMPKYDYVYLGDTKRVPYGNRSQETILEYTKEAVNYLFQKENCAIIIIACNTASARALRKIQREYLPNKFPDRKILGVLIPTVEECKNFKRVGVIGTTSTIDSNTFPIEMKKIKKNIKIFQNNSPLLVPLIEEGDLLFSVPFLKKYLKVFSNKKIEALILGCTHYPILKNLIKKEIEKEYPKIKIISQDEIIPMKLKKYFEKHMEIETKLSQNFRTKILVTDITKNIVKLSAKWFGKKTQPKLINLNLN